MDSSAKEGPSVSPTRAAAVGEEAMDDFEVISYAAITAGYKKTGMASPVGVTEVPSPENVDDAMDTSSAVLSEQPTTRRPFKSSSDSSLKKDFSISLSSLLLEITESDLQVAFKKVCDPLSKPTEAKEVSPGDDFEVVESSITPPKKTSPFVTGMIEESQKARTENNAPTFSTSGDPRVDFFFGVIEQSRKERTIDLLQDSWRVEPLDTLKLLANLRDIRDGKGIRVQYQECLYWLYQNHPKTLYENLEQLVCFGYWKDILHLLVIILFDGYMHPFFEKDASPKNKRKHERPSKVQIQRHKKRLQKRKLAGKETSLGSIRKKPFNNRNNSRNSWMFTDEKISAAQGSRRAVDEENRIYNKKVAEYFKVPGEVSRIPGKEMQEMRVQFAREKLANDVKYRVFFGKIAQVFASQLISDLEEMKRKKSGPEDKKEVSLAGKWAPSLEAHFDKYTLIASGIGLEIVKQRRGIHLDILTKRVPVATYLARKLYHKEYCLPLRRYLEVPEHYISAKEFQKINYKRVAAKSMRKNKETFIKHDKSRFLEYLLDPSSKVAGASLKPVELITEAMDMDKLSDKKDGDIIKRLILEKQWISLVDSVKSSGGGGLLRNAVAVCDVSGSMAGIPMQAAIGLTLLTMAASEEPWNSMCITFHETPTVFNLDTDLGLLNSLSRMKGMPWGGSTDLQKVFELIVDTGKKQGLSDEQMPKILFIFTDMEFDEAFDGQSSWKKSEKTNFEWAKDLFQSEGYSMPAVVFWNLRDSGGSGGEMGKKSTPVQKNELGVCLLSGWSGQMLSYVMNQEEIPEDDFVEVEEEGNDGEEKVVKVKEDKPSALSQMTPLSVMLGILDNEKYQGLKVWD